MIKYYCDNQQCGIEITGENLPQASDLAELTASECAIENNLYSLQKSMLESFLLQSLNDKIYCDTCKTTVKNNIKAAIVDLLGAIDGV